MEVNASSGTDASRDETVEELGLEPVDVDFYKADLQKGDVLSGGFDRARSVGELNSILGVGDNGIFGTGDDVDIDFVVGPFAPEENFEGEEDTAARTAFGLSTGSQAVVPISDLLTE